MMSNSQNKLNIRRFRNADRQLVISLWSSAFPSDPPWNKPSEIIDRKLKRDADLFLVGEVKGEIVAAVIGGYDGFRGWIYHLAVASKLRRTGIGKDMVEELERRLKKLGCTKINLQVRSNNLEVVEFYRTLGYKVEDHTSMGKLITGFPE